MDDKNNPNPNEDPSNLPPKGDEINDEKGKGKGSKEDKSKADEAYRQQQSRADKERARADKSQQEDDDTRERLEFLEGVVGETMRDRLVNDFIKEHGETYPDVTAEDLQRFASSPDDIEEVAKYLQGKQDAFKQKTLADVREVPEDTITEEELEKAKKAIKPNDPNRFSKFLALQAKKIIKK